MDQEIIKNNLVEIWKDLGKVQWIQTTGNSMQPLIYEGMEVAVKFCYPKQISIGDIIAFERGKDTVVHRVIGRSKVDKIKVLIEKGDNNPNLGRLPEFNIMGKVIALKTKDKTIDITGHFWKILGYLFVIYGWCFTGIFLFLFQIKRLLFGKEKKPWSQKVYRVLMETLLFLPRFITRILKRLKRK